jgi:hypothetical protein
MLSQKDETSTELHSQFLGLEISLILLKKLQETPIPAKNSSVSFAELVTCWLILKAITGVQVNNKMATKPEVLRTWAFLYLRFEEESGLNIILCKNAMNTQKAGCNQYITD